MTKISTVAKKYAKALFSSTDHQQHGEVSRLFSQFQELLRNNLELVVALNAPVYSVSNKVAVIDGIMGDELDKQPVLRNVICELLKNRRLIEIDSVIAAFNELVLTASRVLSVSFTSSKELANEQQQEWQRLLSDKFGSDLEIDWQVQPDLIGGCLIRCGDVVIDLSLSAKLKKFKRELLDTVYE
jgi:F-type H+-transporting ATPase subunit delta